MLESFGPESTRRSKGDEDNFFPSKFSSCTENISAEGSTVKPWL